MTTFLHTEKMAANIREEIRRLHRRKQLHFNPQTSGGDSSDMEGGPSSPSSSSAACRSNTYSYSPSDKEKPLFTFRQVHPRSGHIRQITMRSLNAFFLSLFRQLCWVRLAWSASECSRSRRHRSERSTIRYCTWNCRSNTTLLSSSPTIRSRRDSSPQPRQVVSYWILKFIVLDLQLKKKILLE